MHGVVACEALYNLVERFAPDADVRYVPAELHEFPVNVPVDEAITERIRDAIDDLDEPTRETIVVSYALGEAARTELSTRHAALVVSETADCTSAVLPDRDGAYGENKATRTLYLTRGWIDCGVDSYKLYRAYRGDVDDLVDTFAAAADDHPDMRLAWHRGQRFERAIGRQSAAGHGPLDTFFHSVVGYFDRVALVDTGDLYEFHHQYADRVRGFVERLQQANNGDGRVDLTVVDGNLARFRELLQVHHSRD